MGPSGTKRIVRLFFVLCFVPMFGVFPFLAAVNNPNENVRTYTTIALVQHGTLRLDEVVKVFGWTNDMALVPDAPNPPYRVSVKAPATSLAGVLPYAVFSAVSPHFGMPYPAATSPPPDRARTVAYLTAVTWLCRIFAVQVPCLVFLIWFERYLRDVSRDVSLRLSAVAAAGLGTNYLAYNHMFASHALFAIAAFLAFGLTERALRKSRGDGLAIPLRVAFIAGWCTGWTVSLEYHALPLAVVLALYGVIAFRRPTRLAAFAAGGLFHVALMMLFQWRAFGNPLTPGHRMVESGLKVHHQTALFGATTPDLDHVSALWFDLGFGFFGTSPYMWLGLLVVPFGLLFPRGTTRKLTRLATIVWLVGLFAVSLGVSGFGNWRGGWTVGPRFLGAAPPFFAMGALLVTERIARGSPTRRAVVRGVAGGLALASVVTIGTVGLVYDTLPEEIERPFAQFALPMIRTGFVPHHVGEWFGWSSTTFWYVACACLLAAPLVAAVRAETEHGVKRWAVRGAAVVVALAVGLAPAFTSRAETEPAARQAVRGLVLSWEPKDRDRISTLRVEAERYGPRRPCMWHRLAELDRIVGLEREAMADERRAGAPRERCPRRPF